MWRTIKDMTARYTRKYIGHIRKCAQLCLSLGLMDTVTNQLLRLRLPLLPDPAEQPIRSESTHSVIACLKAGAVAHAAVRMKS